MKLFVSAQFILLEIYYTRDTNKDLVMINFKFFKIIQNFKQVLPPHYGHYSLQVLSLKIHQ
jgi:hypothetical protein